MTTRAVRATRHNTAIDRLRIEKDSFRVVVVGLEKTLGGRGWPGSGADASNIY